MDLIPMDPNTATAVIGSNTVKLQNPDRSLNRNAIRELEAVGEITLLVEEEAEE